MADKEILYNYLLQLADSSLVLAQQNGTWCGHGPILEQDIAITNITLDLLGQARNFYQYAADLRNEMEGNATNTEDTLAYHRNERDFKNLLLGEQENGDWGQTILRQFFYTIYLKLLYTSLSNCTDERLAGIAAKSLKEITYHDTWCTEWINRLGDGTEESNNRMQKAVKELMPYTGEMFLASAEEETLQAAGLIPDLAELHSNWIARVKEVFAESNLSYPEEKVFMHQGGKQGKHTEKLGYILAEMQYLQRSYPGAEW